MWSNHTAGLCPPPPPSLSRPPPLLPPPGAHSPSPSPVPASAPQAPQGPGQPCRPQGSHLQPGSIRSRDTSPQKGEGAAGGSALLCISNGTAALQWEAGTTPSWTVLPRCPFIPWSSRPARNASCVSCGPSQPEGPCGVRPSRPLCSLPAALRGVPGRGHCQVPGNARAAPYRCHCVLQLRKVRRDVRGD